MKTAQSKWLFADLVEDGLKNNVSYNKKSIEKRAAGFGLFDKNLIKELTELAIVRRARAIVQMGKGVSDTYDGMLALYKNQVNLSHRTSHSILLQQYSTPAPVSYLAGVFAGIDKDVSVFEPSAGNGLLTIAARPQNVTVNEIDPVRRANLERQGYKKGLAIDAIAPFKGFEKSFDAVLTNPPFGHLDEPVMYDTFPIKALEHLMALRALDCMKDNGRASIIIGGHTHWDELGRITGRDRIFFNYLYSRYNVIDVLNINGGLYSRQGTSFDVRLILIAGRKLQPQGHAPLKKEEDTEISSYKNLYGRVTEDMNYEPMMKIGRVV